MWHKTEEDKPPVHTLVIGVWEENSMKCWMNNRGQWIDYWHNSYCYVAPDWWTDDPMGKKL